jgi:hypothetical protein
MGPIRNNVFFEPVDAATTTELDTLVIGGTDEWPVDQANGPASYNMWAWPNFVKPMSNLGTGGTGSTGIGNSNYALNSPTAYFPCYFCGKGNASALPPADVNGNAWAGADIGAYQNPTAAITKPTIHSGTVLFAGDSTAVNLGVRATYTGAGSSSPMCSAEASASSICSPIPGLPGQATTRETPFNSGARGQPLRALSLLRPGACRRSWP